jgi:ribose 5-phosphate isomerase RpiB
MIMHVAVASDHAGFSLKQKVVEYLGGLGQVLVLGGRVIGEELAHELVGAFVGAKLSQEARHLRRLVKIDAIEAKCGLEVLNNRPTVSNSPV